MISLRQVGCLILLATLVVEGCHDVGKCKRRVRDADDEHRTDCEEESSAEEFMKKLIVKFNDYRKDLWADCVNKTIAMIKPNKPEIEKNIREDKELMSLHGIYTEDLGVMLQKLLRTKICFFQYRSECMSLWHCMKDGKIKETLKQKLHSKLDKLRNLPNIDQLDQHLNKVLNSAITSF